jgi:pilus assembly protein CpaE
VSQNMKTLVALDAGVDRDAVSAALPDEIHLLGIVDGLDESWSVLQETAADLLIIACAGYSERALFLIDSSRRQRPERPVVVFADGSPNGFVRRVFEMGGDDVVTLPESPETVRFSLEKALARKLGSAVASGASIGALICVLGPKGGAGKTLVACNLAVSLAETGKRVALVDLDLQFGDVGLALGLAPDKTIADLARAGGSLDGDKVGAYLTRHASGVDTLLAPTRPDHAAWVTVEFLKDLYSTLRATHDYVVVDTPPNFTPEVIVSIDTSSRVCLVGTLDTLSLKNTKLGLETLDLMGYDAERIALVLNRADSRVGLERDDVVAVLGRTPEIEIPSDRQVPRSINEAVPLVQSKERSEAARAFRKLAELYADVGSRPTVAAPVETGRRGLLGLARRS